MPVSGMEPNLAATPLIALEATALDTETTGLDPRTARIVQIGAVRVRGAELAGSEVFDRLVNPGLPIPPIATDVHGITDQAVARALPFAQIAPELESFFGPSAVIGHTIAYDLEVLKREYDRAGRPWRPPQALDVRILAECVQPALASYDLERLCRWLGIDLQGRHTALGDATAAAHIFLALVPMLRERGIRTLAEAASASQAVGVRREQATGPVPLPPSPVPAVDVPRSASRLDSFAYRHRVRDVMSSPAVIVPATMAVREAIRLLLEKKVSSVFVEDGNGALGIVTERDLLRALDADAGMMVQVGSIMSRPLQAVSPNDFVYRAIGRMSRLGLRHLAVCDARGDLVGAVTTRNLLRDRATTAIELGDEMESAGDAAALARAWSKLPSVAQSLIGDDVDPRIISAVISAEMCDLTRRAAELAEAHMAATGRGGPPVEYAVLVLGSAGRGESLLAADQDNAIVFESGEPGGTEDRWFEALAVHMSAILDAAGVPFCKGGVMAKNPDWRLSLDGWRETIDRWVRRQQPKDLLNVDIFFDGLPVHGNTALGESIWERAYYVGHRNESFIKLLTELARDWRPPLTLLGNIRSGQDGRTDLKRGGLMPLFTSARVLSIRHDVRARSTPERFRGIAAKGVGAPADIEAITEAHRTILEAMLKQQLADIAAGVPPSANVDISRLDKASRRRIKTALRSVHAALDLVGEGLF